MRRSLVVPGLLACAALCGAADAAPVAETSSSASVVAGADALANAGKHTEAIAALEAWLSDHPNDQLARQHLLSIRVAQKETEIRAVLQEQSENKGLIVADTDYQSLRALADEDIRRRLTVVEYLLSQNRMSEAAQACNSILRDHPKEPAALRLKFRILNTVVERERKEMLKDKEYRRGEAINDVIEDGIFPRDSERTRRQVFIFQEDIDDAERAKVRVRLQERISLNQDQAKVWDVMRTLFAVAGINYVVLDSAVGDETVSLHLVDDTVESALNAVGKLAKVRFSYTDGTVFVSSDADDGLVTEIIRLRSGLTNVEAEVNASSFGGSDQNGANGGGGGGANGQGAPANLLRQNRQPGQQGNRPGQNGGPNGQNGQNGQQNGANAQGTVSDLEKFLAKLPEIVVGWQDTHKWHLDRKSNTLYLRANPWVIGEVKRLLHAMDYNNVQVLIESRFVEVSEDALRQLGVDWKVNDPAKDTISAGQQVVNVTSLAGITRPGGSFLQGVIDLGSTQIQAKLSALEQEGKSDTLAEPKILTLNNATGVIEIVRKVPYVERYDFQSTNSGSTVDNNGNSTIVSTATPVPQWGEVEEGYQLKIQPSIARNSDTITLRLLPKTQRLEGFETYSYNYFPGQGSTAQELKVSKPRTATRSFETILHIQNGRTVALGGLADELQAEETSGTPFVQRIPILGYLFKNERKESKRRNLVILVTANLVEPSGARVGDDVLQLRDTARILLPESGVAGMEPDKPVMTEPAHPEGPHATTPAGKDPWIKNGRRP